MPRAQNRTVKCSIFKEDEIHFQSGYVIRLKTSRLPAISFLALLILCFSLSENNKYNIFLAPLVCTIFKILHFGKFPLKISHIFCSVSDLDYFSRFGSNFFPESRSGSAKNPNPIRIHKTRIKNCECM